MDEKPELWAPLTAFVKMHARYFTLFKEAINLLFYGDGPLPFHCRHYLAIMAASRHKCQFLVNVHKEEFLRYFGPESWIEGGIHSASQKIQDLDLTNRLLAHRPWLLQRTHLQKLCSAPNNWSLSELIQGALIVSHTHALCSLINGCGVASQPAAIRRVLTPSNPTQRGKSPVTRRSLNGGCISLDNTSSTTTAMAIPKKTNGTIVKTKNQSGVAASAPAAQTNNTKTIVGKCRSFSTTEASSQTNGSGTKGKEDKVQNLMVCMQVLNGRAWEPTQQENMKHFVAINRQNCESAYYVNPIVDCFKDSEFDFSTKKVEHHNFSEFTDDKDFAYSEFFRKSDGLATPTLSIHDFSWEDQGYSIISELYSQASSVLEDKFKLIQDLTYHTMGGHKNVDTTKYRTAVWNYIQSLFGISHDDYDYSEIGQLLSRQMKTYIKTLCCYPDRMQQTMRDSVMVDFLFSEKVHVNLLIFEGRFQAEILYFLRTVLRFLSS